MFIKSINLSEGRTDQLHVPDGYWVAVLQDINERRGDRESGNVKDVRIRHFVSGVPNRISSCLSSVQREPNGFSCLDFTYFSDEPFVAEAAIHDSEGAYGKRAVVSRQVHRGELGRKPKIARLRSVQGGNQGWVRLTDLVRQLYPEGVELSCCEFLGSVWDFLPFASWEDRALPFIFAEDENTVRCVEPRYLRFSVDFARRNLHLGDEDDDLDIMDPRIRNDSDEEREMIDGQPESVWVTRGWANSVLYLDGFRHGKLEWAE